jgi:hypothetical protein
MNIFNIKFLNNYNIALSNYENKKKELKQLNEINKQNEINEQNEIIKQNEINKQNEIIKQNEINEEKKNIKYLIIEDKINMNLENIKDIFSNKNIYKINKNKQSFFQNKKIDTFAYEGNLEEIRNLYFLNINVTSDGSDAAAANGHLNILIFLNNTNNLQITKKGICFAVKRNKLEIVKYLIELKIYPQPYMVDLAILNNHIKMVKLLMDEYLIYPTILAESYMGGSGNIELIEYLITKQIYPNNESVNYAAGRNDVNMIRYLNFLDINGTSYSANIAAKYGNINVIYELKTYNIIATSYGADDAANNGHIEIIQELQKEKIYITLRGVNETIKNGHLNVICYLLKNNFFNKSRKSKYDKIFLISDSANIAAEFGHIEIIKELEKYNILVTSEGANKASKNGHYETIKYLLQNNINLTQYGINIAAINYHIKIIEEYFKYNFTISQDYINKIILNGNLNMIKFVCDNNMFPTQKTIDNVASNPAYGIYNNIENIQLLRTYNLHVSREAATIAAQKYYGKIVKELYKNRIYIIGNIKTIYKYYGINKNDNIDTLIYRNNMEVVYVLHANGFYCTSIGADYAVLHNMIDFVKTLINIGIKPTSYGANNAAMNDNYEMLYYLRTQNIHATSDCIYFLKKYGSDSMIEDLANNGIYMNILTKIQFKLKKI